MHNLSLLIYLFRNIFKFFVDFCAKTFEQKYWLRKKNAFRKSAVQITELYAANTVDCLTLHELVMETYNRLFLANPTDLDLESSGAP